MVEDCNSIKKSIGGYFSLELNPGCHYHNGCINLNTARNCFEVILRFGAYHTVWMPIYTCGVMFETTRNVGVNIKYYYIDKDFNPLFKDGLPQLRKGEAFLYTNYFGIKNSTVEHLSRIYKDNLIVDNSQAFFSIPIDGVQTFYSARKFFGVPDGAYLYTNKNVVDNFPKDKSIQRMSHLLMRIEDGAECGYNDFIMNEQSLSGQPIKMMSEITSSILGSIDYESAAFVRRRNLDILHSSLKNYNLLKVDVEEDETPMCYPFLCEGPNMREILREERVYVASYWPNVIAECSPQSTEYEMANCLLPLPLDQRYDEKDMKRIIDIILKNV